MQRDREREQKREKTIQKKRDGVRRTMYTEQSGAREEESEGERGERECQREETDHEKIELFIGARKLQYVSTKKEMYTISQVDMQQKLFIMTPLHLPGAVTSLIRHKVLLLLRSFDAPNDSDLFLASSLMHGVSALLTAAEIKLHSSR